MAWRKFGLLHSAEEILVLTCDSERDIGFEDGRLPREHFRIMMPHARVTLPLACCVRHKPLTAVAAA
jgi:hypothetical protein